MPSAEAPPTGLTWSEARLRMQLGGRNLLPQDAPRHWPAILAGVLSEPMLLLLLATAAVYLLLGDRGEAIALLFSVVAVVGLAFFQAVRSEHALQALRELGSPRARVLRDGEPATIAGADVVVGDLLLLEEGDRVAADARLATAHDLQLDESLLTGESAPVLRQPPAGDDVAALEAATVRASTLVVRGRGSAVVTAIGADTAVGDIHAAMRRIRPRPSPMQREIRQAVLVFAALGIAASALVVLLEFRAHGDWLQALLAGLTLAIANIPEEFPVVLTVFLALGAWRLARQRALVRRAPAIETLGAITELCTDKTGTLTRNRMAVAELVAPTQRGVPAATLPPALQALLEWGDRASPAHPHDPMELAMRASVEALGHPSAFDAQRMHEYPFDPQLAASATVWDAGADAPLQVAGKGAPERMLALCRADAALHARVHAEVERMAAHGLRVIGVARAQWPSGATLPRAADGFVWEWQGLVGLHDPLREGVPDAVRRARAAGIRVRMLTGDHLATARAIAAEAGIPGEAVLADTLDDLDDAAYLRRIEDVGVFARMRPQQKLRLVEALRTQGAIVGMTGDGVNDAPSLMAAHVGIAMGARGTDVAREAAAMVLLDDDFVTVVDAVAAGRAIHDNIRRAVGYILSVHVPITGLALLPLVVGTPLVLLPLHVVFLELIIDPASTLVFEREPADADVMRRPPRPRGARLLDLRSLGRGLGHGGLAFAAVAAVHLAATAAALPQPQVAAAAFMAVVSGNIALALAHRGHRPAEARAQRNPAFAILAIAAAAVLALVVWVPPLARWFHFQPPPAAYVAAAVLLPGLLLGLAHGARRLRTRAAAV